MKKKLMDIYPYNTIELFITKNTSNKKLEDNLQKNSLLNRQKYYPYVISQTPERRFNWMNALETTYSNDKAISSGKCLYLGTDEELANITPDSDEVTVEHRQPQILLWQ